MNAVERESFETRVLNPTASEASYKPKQRSYRTTNLKIKVKRRRRNIPDPSNGVSQLVTFQESLKTNYFYVFFTYFQNFGASFIGF